MCLLVGACEENFHSVKLKKKSFIAFGTCLPALELKGRSSPLSKRNKFASFLKMEILIWY